MLAVIQEEASLVVADGTRLDADIYRPDCTGAYPVLLMRQPYGRRIASTVVYAHPRWYAAHGYIVVIQDVRGRGTSEGDFRLFANDRDDGLATVNWAAQLPGSTGAVGMYGFSYQGMTQLYAAEQQPSALKTICPAMVGYDVYHDWAYEGGAFCLQASLGWALQMAAETARLRGDAQAFSELRQAAQSLPLNGAIASQPECLRRLAPDSFYWDWLQHPDPAAAYWQHLRPDLTQVDLPMLHIGGWFDTYLRGTVRLYRELAAQARTP
ncbi:MAG: CocE/NonD family hydrolase, partial [Cyanobacteria bacterium P01_H01_bin.121]